jgi:hypothetical protein
MQISSFAVIYFLFLAYDDENGAATVANGLKAQR